MRKSIFRWLLAALLSAVAFACHAPARAQFPRREGSPPDADRVPEALEKLVAGFDEEALARPPERDFKVEKGPAEGTKLFRADPKLLENKYRARLALAVAAIDPMPGPSVASDEFNRAINDLSHGVKRLVDGRARMTFFT